MTRYADNQPTCNVGSVLTSVRPLQTARVWDVASGETKSELRGHEHVVEAAVFAPLAAYPALLELSGVKVRPAHPLAARLAMPAH
jgi:platelet-activating factor acetylhydrolase IB subunit alpha